MVSILDKVRNGTYKKIRNIYVILIATSCYIKQKHFYQNVHNIVTKVDDML